MFTKRQSNPDTHGRRHHSDPNWLRLDGGDSLGKAETALIIAVPTIVLLVQICVALLIYFDQL